MAVFAAGTLDASPMALMVQNELHGRHFPGLRDNDPYLEAIHGWFPDQLGASVVTSGVETAYHP